MFKNKAPDGRLNLSGRKIAALRTGKRLSQRKLADELQDYHLDLDKNAIQKIESGQRFVTDIELRAIAAYFAVTCDTLTE